MPLPDLNDLRPIDPIMTDLSVGFKQDSYFWDIIAPPVKVGQKSGTYFIYQKDYWFRAADGMNRPPGGPYAQTHHGVTTGTYDCEEFGVEESVDDVTRAAAQTPVSLDVKAVQHLTTVMQMKLELDAAHDFWNADAWHNAGAGRTQLDGQSQWDDYTNSNPITNLYAAKLAVKRLTGKQPNSLAVNQEVYNILREHPKIIDKFQQVQVGIMNPVLIAQALDIPKLYVLESVQNTAHEGQDFVGADVWDKDMSLLWHRTPTLGMEMPCTAYTFIWDRMQNFPWAMQKYRRPELASDQHRIFTHVDRKIVTPDYAHVFTTPIG